MTGKRSRLQHRPGQPEPAPGAVLEVGSRPDAARGFAGDLLTFERLPDGGWIRRHNWSPRAVRSSWREVRFWLPARRVPTVTT